MKKNLSLTLIAILSVAIVSAQEFRMGITGAMNVSRYAVESAGISVTTDSRIGFKAGFRENLL